MGQPPVCQDGDKDLDWSPKEALTCSIGTPEIKICETIKAGIKLNM